MKGCEELKEEAKDITLCKDVPLKLTGFKREGASCRSEAGGTKDPGETVLLLLDLHMSTETTSGGVLQSLQLAHVLNTLLEPRLTMICGLIKIEVLGWLGCLATGLKNIQTTENLEITCKVNATTHDRETGTCKGLLCEELEKDPLMASLNGTTEEDAWESFILKGKPTKDIFIDD